MYSSILTMCYCNHIFVLRLHFHVFLIIGKVWKFTQLINMTFPHLSKDLEIFRNMIIFCSETYLLRYSFNVISLLCLECISITCPHILLLYYLDCSL